MGRKPAIDPKTYHHYHRTECSARSCKLLRVTQTEPSITKAALGADRQVCFVGASPWLADGSQLDIVHHV
jgi:hypothetical protein